LKGAFLGCFQHLIPKTMVICIVNDAPENTAFWFDLQIVNKSSPRGRLKIKNFGFGREIQIKMVRET